MKHNITQTAKTIILALILVAGLQFVLAATWTPAPANPPANNTEAPINEDKYQQYKKGPLLLNTGWTENGQTVKAPTGLQAWGTSIFHDGIKLPTGAGDGLVLTSDPDGNATWEALPATSEITQTEYEIEDSYQERVPCAGPDAFNVWGPNGGIENDMYFTCASNVLRSVGGNGYSAPSNTNDLSDKRVKCAPGLPESGRFYVTGGGGEVENDFTFSCTGGYLTKVCVQSATCPASVPAGYTATKVYCNFSSANGVGVYGADGTNMTVHCDRNQFVGIAYSGYYVSPRLVYKLIPIND